MENSHNTIHVNIFYASIRPIMTILCIAVRDDYIWQSHGHRNEARLPTCHWLFFERPLGLSLWAISFLHGSVNKVGMLCVVFTPPILIRRHDWRALVVLPVVQTQSIENTKFVPETRGQNRVYWPSGLAHIM